TYDHVRCILRLFDRLYFHETPTSDIYTLSLHDALPICARGVQEEDDMAEKKSARPTFRLAAALATVLAGVCMLAATAQAKTLRRSEEHTSELQSLAYLVCRLLLEKKKQMQ